MLKKISTLVIILSLIYGCGGEGEIQNNYNDGFDRFELLTNLTDNIIIPAYANFQLEILELENAKENFISNINQTSLDLLREKWLDAYLAWQHVEMFDINKAEEIDYRRKMNAYPCNVTRINLNISSQEYDFNNSNYYSSQGFPALDYMLNGIQQDILEAYTGLNGTQNLDYLSNLINQIVVNTEDIINEWNADRDIFISSTSNTATSSLNKITNDFIFYYEKGFRANKFGIPAGVFSGSPLPGNIEAYYHNILTGNTSQILSLEALQAVKKFFSGISFDNSYQGLGLSDYLLHLDALNNNENLGDVISTTFEQAETSISDLDDDLMNQINTNNYDMLVTYDKIQAGVVLLKVDMLGFLSIDVDYLDADGD